MRHAQSHAACDEAFIGPNVCTGLLQVQLFKYIINTFIYKLNIKQFCDVPCPNQKYDFIVVGGGTAGAVVASRLSEIWNWRVLLIEAGPEEPLQAMVPSMVASFLDTELDWQYKTTNELKACLSTGGSCSWPRGKNLGGTSVHNGMMYMRGHPEDYNQWNIPGWSYNDVLPFFKKAEANQCFHDKYHGSNGPVTVDRFPHQPAISQNILNAAKEAGFGVSDDLNGRKITGFAVAQTMNLKGIRVSSATAYLRPVGHRKNLHVLLNAQVTKVVVQNVQGIKVATGVELIKDNHKYIINATKEVILSAGAIGSPHLLLLSGVGPQDHLYATGIKIVKNLPGVGKNLQNHVAFTIPFSVNDPDSDVFTESALQYIFNQTGPMSSTGLSQLTGIVASPYTSPDHPDLQFFFGGYRPSCEKRSNARTSFEINAVYLHPKSRGELKLADNNPLNHPIITQNYLTHEEDVKGLIEAIKVVFKLADTEALKIKDIKSELKQEPACNKFAFMSDDYWNCAITWNTGPENHQVGSCKMGFDSMSVVDRLLKVYGIRGLRVADASIIPQIMSGNTAAPTIMIGERVAEFIKQDHIYQQQQQHHYHRRYRHHSYQY